MQNIEIKLNDVLVDEYAERDDFGGVTVVVDVLIDGEIFGLNYQSTANWDYEETSSVSLNSQTGDAQAELAALFDYVDDDGDEMSGEYSESFERIEALARQIAQVAFDEHFAKDQ